VLRVVDLAVGAALLPFRRRAVLGVLASLVLIALLVGHPQARAGIGTLAAMAGKPLHSRAAFSFEERFDRGPTRWMDPDAVTSAERGTIRVHGAAWDARTAGLKDYQMAFTARIDRKAIGWAVRSVKPGGYYVFKLVERGRGNDPKARRLELHRYLVEDGKTANRSQKEPVPLDLYVPEASFLNISVRVTPEQILTIVNEFGVDAWKLKKGEGTAGAGLLAEDGEAFLVRSLTVSGNEDFLGLFLWGAEETLRSVWRNLSSLTATVL
jgi:hypothetical protein